jgi:ferric-dicitrate binding protein FerR (iron transport regulator)
MGLFVGLQKTTYSSTNSLQMVVLPDESRVTLEPNSSFSYNKVLYALRRTLDLKGNAFFEVEKGSDFRVQSELGSVEVQKDEDKRKAMEQSDEDSLLRYARLTGLRGMRRQQ